MRNPFDFASEIGGLLYMGALVCTVVQ